jgi:ubiquinone/menaquinone biosynthesis C-methylase UbiE
MSDDLVKLKRFYGWNAPIYDVTRWVMLRHRSAAAGALLLRPRDRVLDVGCGTGLNFRHVRRFVGPAGRIVGVDYSDAMLRRAARRRGSGTMLIRAEASRLRLASRFDGVLFAYSLTMIPDWRGALARACEHLVDGGRLVILDFGRIESGLAPIRRGFERYLAANHVDPQRDLSGEVERLLGNVEALRPNGAFITLLRGVR